MADQNNRLMALWWVITSASASVSNTTAIQVTWSTDRPSERVNHLDSSAAMLPFASVSQQLLSRYCVRGIHCQFQTDRCSMRLAGADSRRHLSTGERLTRVFEYRLVQLQRRLPAHRARRTHLRRRWPVEWASAPLRT